jgi:hypothetical protein
LIGHINLDKHNPLTMFIDKGYIRETKNIVNMIIRYLS